MNRPSRLSAVPLYKCILANLYGIVKFGGIFLQNYFTLNSAQDKKLYGNVSAVQNMFSAKFEIHQGGNYEKSLG